MSCFLCRIAFSTCRAGWRGLGIVGAVAEHAGGNVDIKTLAVRSHVLEQTAGDLCRGCALQALIVGLLGYGLQPCYGK